MSTVDRPKYSFEMSRVTSPTMKARLIPLKRMRGIISCTFDECARRESVAAMPTDYTCMRTINQTFRASLLEDCDS